MAFSAARTHQWPTCSCLSPKTPFSFSAKLLPSQSNPTCTGGWVYSVPAAELCIWSFLMSILTLGYFSSFIRFLWTAYSSSDVWTAPWVWYHLWTYWWSTVLSFMLLLKVLNSVIMIKHAVCPSLPPWPQNYLPGRFVSQSSQGLRLGCPISDSRIDPCSRMWVSSFSTTLMDLRG